MASRAISLSGKEVIWVYKPSTFIYRCQILGR